MLIFSPNMLKTFSDCPQKYIFKYVEKISVPQNTSKFEKGKKVHALAHYFLRGDDISKLEQGLNEDEKKTWKTLKNNEFFQKKYVNSEYNLACKIGNYMTGGRLDALMTDDIEAGQDKNTFNSLCILDYKTGTPPNNPEHDFQTMVYLMCVSKFFNQTKNLKFVYIDLKNNANKIVEFNNELKILYEKALVAACDKITSYIPCENIKHTNRCGFCEYKKICR